MALDAAVGWDAGPSEGEEPGTYWAIVPDPRDPEPRFDHDGQDDDEPPPEDALTSWVDNAFAHGFERYLNWIGPLLDARAPSGGGDPDVLQSRLPSLAIDARAPSGGGDPDVLQSRLPSLAIDVAADWRPTGAEAPRIEDTVDSAEIVFDGDLVATLLQLYVLDGWQPLIQIGADLQSKVDALNELRASSGGTPPGIKRLAPWEPAAWLFRLARNGVGLLVREELAQIEAQAGVRLESQIATTQTRFATLDGELEWQVTEVPSGVTKTGEEKTRRVVQLKDRDLAETLAKALKDAVRCRRALDLTLVDLSRYENQVRRSPMLRASEKDGSALGTAVASGRASAQQAVAQARALADAARGQLKRNSPLLLLVFPSLKPDFETAQLEAALHEQVLTVRSALAELRDKVRPETPYTRQLVPGVDAAKQQPLWSALLDLDPPPAGVESELAVRALAGVSDGAASWFPLVSEKTLHELVALEQIEADSLTYVVYAHYVQALGERLDRKLEQEEQSKQFWLCFSQLAAAASLASLLSPESAPAVVPLRAAVWAADLVLMAQSLWSVTEQLRRIQRLRDQALAESSATVDALGQLGDLLAVRQDILAGLAEEAVVLLLTTLVGLPDFQLTRRALLAYSFYLDVQTLVATDGATEA